MLRETLQVLTPGSLDLVLVYITQQHLLFNLVQLLPFGLKHKLESFIKGALFSQLWKTGIPHLIKNTYLLTQTDQPR